jgi:hypothetical protein
VIRRRRVRRLVAAFLALVVATGVVSAFDSAVSTAPAEAAVASAFNPGNIISDSVFYNASALSAAQVQGFLQARVPSCSAGYVCLKDYRQDTWSRPADAMCGAYTGVAAQRASEIIWAVAQACGVNPQVLIVLLQKEQGLVTSTAPSATRYERATGYACPDTAPCDAQFFGFYNQVYKAAWQYERYRLFPNNYGYRAGRVNNILWHPNSACGSSQVYIENQATAGLYIYTPYRPNGAALANLYGTGDGCSSYGNRNFWRMFTDWFGNPQGGGSFAKLADDPTIYLLTATHRYPVADMATLQAFWALGPYRTVTADYLSSFTLGPALGNLIRDPTTGDIYYFDSGVRHHVATCEMLLEFGTSCSEYLDLMPTQLGALTLGSPLSVYVRSAVTGEIWLVDDGEKRKFHTIDALIANAGGAMPAYTDLTAAGLAAIPTGPDFLFVGDAVRRASTGSAYVVSAEDQLTAFSTPALLSEMGLGAIFDIGEPTFEAYTVGSATVGPVVTCGATDYWVGGGSLHPLGVSTTHGLTVAALSDELCAVAAKASGTTGAKLFVRDQLSGVIYLIENGSKLAAGSMAALIALNGGTTPTWLPSTSAVLATIPGSTQSLTPNTLVKSAVSPTVYFVDGLDRLIPINSFETAAQFGAHGYAVVSEETIASYEVASEILTTFVLCDSQRHVATGGRLMAISADATPGVTPVSLSPASCGALPISTASFGGEVFLRGPDGNIYLVRDGSRRFATTIGAIQQFSGSTAPMWAQTSSAVIASIPQGPDLLGPGLLVRSAAAPMIYFVDGPSTMIPITTFGIAAEFGSTGYRVVSDATLAAYTPAPAPLTVAVTCGSEAFLAGGGSLWLIADGDTGGLSTTTLSPVGCAALPRSSSTITGELFVRSSSTGSIYWITGGQRRFVPSGARLVEINGSAPLIWVPMSESTVASIPIGPQA